MAKLTEDNSRSLFDDMKIGGKKNGKRNNC